MPTIITRGLGYDEPTVIQRIIGDRLYGEIIVLDRISGVLEAEDPSPVGTLSSPIFITGAIHVEEALFGAISAVDVISGSLQEECSMSDVRINMYLRDDRTLSLTIREGEDAGSDPVNLTGAKLWFTVKNKTSDPDTSAARMV